VVPTQTRLLLYKIIFTGKRLRPFIKIILPVVEAHREVLLPGMVEVEPDGLQTVPLSQARMAREEILL
jgi:hypothetical protein